MSKFIVGTVLGVSMTFDPTITLGTFLTIVSNVAVLFIAYMNLKVRLSIIETNQDLQKTKMQTLQESQDHLYSEVTKHGNMIYRLVGYHEFEERNPILKVAEPIK